MKLFFVVITAYYVVLFCENSKAYEHKTEVDPESEQSNVHERVKQDEKSEEIVETKDDNSATTLTFGERGLIKDQVCDLLSMNIWGFKLDHSACALICKLKSYRFGSCLHGQCWCHADVLRPEKPCKECILYANIH